MHTVSVQVSIDFTKAGITGSIRYKPPSDASIAERRKRGRACARAYVERNREKERKRWRKVAAERRARDPEAHREALRKYYRKHRENILADKRQQYAQRNG
jgi:hypothetical protein